MQISYPKLIFAGILTLYFLWIAYDPLAGSFLDLVDLGIHETGQGIALVAVHSFVGPQFERDHPDSHAAQPCGDTRVAKLRPPT